MLMYWDSINSTIQPDPSLIHYQLSILYKISWKAFPKLNLWFITVFVAELKKIGLNWVSPIGLHFFNNNFSIIWYLRPFVSFKRSLNKFLILNLFASNWIFFLNFFNLETHCISSKCMICFYYIQFFIKRKFRKQINVF